MANVSEEPILFVLAVVPLVILLGLLILIVSTRARKVPITGVLSGMVILIPVRPPASVHVIQDLANDQLLKLCNVNFAKFACVYVPEEVVGTNLSRLAFEENFDHFEGLLLLNDYVIGLVFGEFESVNKVLESKEEVGLLERAALNLLLIQVVVEKIGQVHQTA